MRRFDLGATLGVCAAIVAGSACATGGVTSPDDAGGPATADGAGADAGAATDASTDRGDGGPSAGDAGVDSAADAGVDSEAGGTVDAAGDAPIDATTDAPIDSTADATGDAAADATAETGTDAAIDAPIDAPAEAPSDASLSDRGSCVTSPSDYCSAIPALAAPPVIDGVLDCGPALEAVTPAGWTGSSSLPAGNSAFVAASWRPDGLYVFIEVVTPAAIPADPGSPPSTAPAPRCTSTATPPRRRRTTIRARSSSSRPRPRAPRRRPSARPIATPSTRDRGPRRAGRRGSRRSRRRPASSSRRSSWRATWASPRGLRPRGDASASTSPSTSPTLRPRPPGPRGTAQASTSSTWARRPSAPPTRTLGRSACPRCSDSRRASPGQRAALVERHVGPGRQRRHRGGERIVLRLVVHVGRGVRPLHLPREDRRLTRRQRRVAAREIERHVRVGGRRGGRERIEGGRDRERLVGARGADVRPLDRHLRRGLRAGGVLRRVVVADLERGDDDGRRAAVRDRERAAEVRARRRRVPDGIEHRQARRRRHVLPARLRDAGVEASRVDPGLRADRRLRGAAVELRDGRVVERDRGLRLVARVVERGRCLVPHAVAGRIGHAVVGVPAVRARRRLEDGQRGSSTRGTYPTNVHEEHLRYEVSSLCPSDEIASKNVVNR